MAATVPGASDRADWNKTLDISNLVPPIRAADTRVE